MQRAIRDSRTRRVAVATLGLGLAVSAAACTPLANAGKVPGGTSVVTAPAPKPTPTPAPVTTAPLSVPAYPGGYLQVGSSGTAVKAVQLKLGVEPATGYFGTLTQAAVTSFQRARGLEVDGQVGPLTWSKIFNVPVPVTASTPAAPKPTTSAGPTYPKIVRQAGLGARGLALIKQYAGKPYLYGAAGPNSFDCSGLTMYVYNQLGVPLMRSANDQYRTTLHVPYSEAQPGDLIFFYDKTGYVYHVGMYAGDGMMWNAPHSGAVVRYENVWYPDQVWVGVPGAKLAS